MRVIAIDPGVKTAVAALTDGKFQGLHALRTVNFWDAYHYMIDVWEPLDVNVVVVEVATDTYVWQKNARSRASVAKAMRVAQDVGAVRREGQLLAEGLRPYFTVVTKPPPGKLNAERFAKLTGYEGRTNQHERDAGMMALAEYKRLTVLNPLSHSPTSPHDQRNTNGGDEPAARVAGCRGSKNNEKADEL